MNISATENFDILLVLASAFENTGVEAKPQTLAQIAKTNLGAMPRDRFELLAQRAEFLDQLPTERRDLWREICLEKLLRKSVRLDPNIHPAHIAGVLSREPKSIQAHILRNLPPDFNQKIAEYLGVEYDGKNAQIVQPEIAELIRREFLGNFVSIEDVYEPTTLDRLSVPQLTKFVRHLGWREVALASRGIDSKETLAGFLGSFAPIDAREIARYLTELHEIKPVWVAEADELVRKNLDADGNPRLVITKIGFRLLAVAYANRDDFARTYTLQKLSGRDSSIWKRLLRKVENEVLASEDVRFRMDKRRKMVEKCADKFAATGSL